MAPKPDLFQDFLPAQPYQPEMAVDESVVVPVVEETNIEPPAISEAPAPSIGQALYGLNLFGDSAEPIPEGPLSKRFTFPPFSVLNAREGDWQARKRAWIGLGIQSEVGRGENLLKMSDTILSIQNGENPGKFGKTFGNASEWKADQDAKRGESTSLKGLTHHMSIHPYDGEQSVAGQNGTSIFDPVLAELCYRWFCPAGGQIVDPFAGGSVRGIVAGMLGFRYYGIDLRAEQIAANIEQRDRIIGPALPGFEEEGQLVQWGCGDSRVLLGPSPVADMVFSCPPYGDLEVYSDDPLDLSAMSHREFLNAYAQIIHLCAAKLRDNRMACFVVGDFRDKKTGYYRGFVADTINLFRDAGMHLYNDAILVTSVGSLPVRLSGQFEGGRKLGKALRNGTPILTPSGWSNIEDLSVGQFVIAGDGTPTEVTGVFSQGVRPLFTVTFHDGASIDADADHQWAIEARGEESSVMTTSQVLDRFGAIPRDPRPMIPFCGPVQFENWPVPLNAYLVGLLLGDGGLTQNTPVLTTADAETVELLPTLLPAGVIVKSRGYDYRLVGEGSRSLKNPLTVALRTLGLMGFGSLKKSVPDIYLWNSVGIRMNVLRGLMDSDGTVSPGPSGCCEFQSGSLDLANDVMFLARSLGARAAMNVRSTSSGNTAYRVRIRGGECPFHLSRKADIWKAANDHRVRFKERKIESIEPTFPGEATCIAVAHPSQLFVAKDFIVTHNTHQNVLCFAKGDPRKAFE